MLKATGRARARHRYRVADEKGDVYHGKSRNDRAEAAEYARVGAI